jgi:hypothetical protein
MNAASDGGRITSRWWGDAARTGRTASLLDLGQASVARSPRVSPTAALLAKYLAHRDFVGLKGDSFGGCNNKKYATKEAIFSAVAISTICR